MSNRRKLKVIPGSKPFAHEQPEVTALRALGVDWTDEPAATYSAQTLRWIAEHRSEARRMNVWTCEECGTAVLCFDLHPGVTPFMVSHHALGDESCAGQCRSAFYSGLEAAVQRDLQGGPTHEWYRPSAKELGRCSRYVRDHVAQGGLLVRAVTA